jgi:pSer/pThr/pTyr-binding forkhead associated (FHA) protein
MQVQLKVVRGKPHGHALRFAEGEFVFGRGPECHVRPNSELVSRQHCLLRVTGSGVLVRDLGSTNGTLVNGTRVVEERLLGQGDVLQLGSLVLQLILEEAPPEVQPSTLNDVPLFANDETLREAPPLID